MTLLWHITYIHWHPQVESLVCMSFGSLIPRLHTKASPQRLIANTGRLKGIVPGRRGMVPRVTGHGSQGWWVILVARVMRQEGSLKQYYLGDLGRAPQTVLVYSWWAFLGTFSPGPVGRTPPRVLPPCPSTSALILHPYNAIVCNCGTETSCDNNNIQYRSIHADKKNLPA